MREIKKKIRIAWAYNGEYALDWERSFHKFAREEICTIDRHRKAKKVYNVGIFSDDTKVWEVKNADPASSRDSIESFNLKTIEDYREETDSERCEVKI